jgi:hypothetical protein
LRERYSFSPFRKVVASDVWWNGSQTLQSQPGLEALLDQLREQGVLQGFLEEPDRLYADLRSRIDEDQR